MIISKDAIKNILNRILKLDKKVESHTHTIAQVNNLQSTLNGKSPTSHNHDTVYSKLEHTHTKSQITDMPTTMKNPNSLTLQFNGTTNKTYDGSSAQTLNITPSAIGAATSSHTHNYLPLSGGILTDSINFSNLDSGTRGIGGTIGGSDYWRLVGGASTVDEGFVELATADNGTEPIMVSQYTGKFVTRTRRMYLLDSNGNTIIPGNLELENMKQILGKDTSGAYTNLITMDKYDRVNIGDPKKCNSVLLAAKSAQITVYDGSQHYTVYHSGNFNPSNYLPLSGGNLTGDLILNGASEQHVTFNNCSKSKLQTYFYKGNSTDSTTILGLWDPTNKEPIWKVNNDWTFEIGKQTTFWKNAIFNNSELTFSNGKGIYGKDSNGAEQRIAVISDACYLGGTNIPTWIRSSVTPQYLDASGNKHDIYHSGNLNIGGRNYINNGNFTDGNVATPRGYWWWGGCSHYNLAVTGGTAIQNSSTSPGGLWTSMALSPNTQYTLSLRCTKENNVKGASWVFEYIKDGKTISSQQFGLTFDGAVHGYTFTTPNNGFTKAQGGLRHEGSNSTAGGYLVIIRYLKLEKGNKVTDYTESPSDIDYKINSKLNTTSTLMFAGYVTNASGIVTTDYNYNSCCSTVTASANSSQKVLEFVAPVKGVYLFLVRCTGANGSNNNYTIHVGGYSYSYAVVASSQDQSGYTERKMNKGESTYVCYWSSSYYYGVTGEVTILRLSIS